MSKRLQKIHRNRDGFFHLCRKAQMNEVALRANDVLRNDVMLRINDVRFAQTEFLPRVLKNTENRAIINPERRYLYELFAKAKLSL